MDDEMGESGTSRSFGQIRAQAEVLAQERFAFLVRERGFTPGPIKRSTYATSIYYARTLELGLEVRLDMWDAYIEAYLVRLHASKPPRQLDVYIDDTRMRMQIPHFLRRVLAVDDPWLEEVLMRWKSAALPSPSSHGDAFAEVVLTDLSTMVERQLDLMLAQPVEVMFPPRRHSS